MEKEFGWKKGYTLEDINRLRKRLYAEYDNLKKIEKLNDPLRYKYLPKSYYAERLFIMHITPWSVDYISRLLTYRFKNERR